MIRRGRPFATMAAVILAVACFPSRAGAVGTRWTADGVPGGAVYGIAVDPGTPSTLYAATDGGAYRSNDGGLSWRLRSTGLTSSELTAIGIAPSVHQVVYAGTTFGGVARSGDGGATWIQSEAGLNGTQINAVAIDPTNSEVAYVASEAQGVFKTVDGGQTWSVSGLLGHIARSLAIDPASPGTVYAGATDGIYRTTDAGGTWVRLRNGLPAHLFTEALAIAPSAPLTLYVGIAPVGGGLLYRTDDGGAHWTQADNGLTSTPLSLAVDPSTPSTAVAGSAIGGLFVTVDSGQTWTHVASTVLPPKVGTLTMDPTDGQIVYAGGCSGLCFLGGKSGLFKSTDGGQTWAHVGHGIRAVDSRALTVDPAGGTLSLGTEQGFYWSADSGHTWHASNMGLADQNIFSMVADLDDPATLYAGTETGGIFKTTDAGATWASSSSGLPPGEPWYGLTIDPSDTQILYAGPSCLGGIDCVVYKSVNGGASWKARGAGLPLLAVEALVVDPSNGSTVYAGLLDGVYKSTDGAASWSRMGNGMGNFPVSALAIDPGSPQTIYAGTTGGIYKSTDGAANWTASSTGLTTKDTRALAVVPGGPVLAGTLGGGVYMSTDAGASWSSWNSGLNGDWVHGFAISGSNIYAATVGGSFARPLG